MCSKLREFVRQYDMVIFDMDGVMTSEQNYWDIAALSVWEMAHSDRYYGEEAFDPDAALRQVKQIRSTVFCRDKVIYRIKDIGINNNWDLVYIQLALWLEYGDFEAGYAFLQQPGLDVDTLYAHAAALYARRLNILEEDCMRNGPVWTACMHCFQAWYLGSEDFAVQFGAPAGRPKGWFLFSEPRGRMGVQPGKASMRSREVPLLDNDKLRRLFAALCDAGLTLGVATGRPDLEMDIPLDLWEFRQYFDPNRLISYDCVMNAERSLCLAEAGIALPKPHPYLFLKAALGRDFPDEKILDGDYAIPGKVLAVGDAGADILSAHAAGFDFLAVLTGAMGEKARPYFVSQGAEYILDKVTDLLEEV